MIIKNYDKLALDKQKKITLQIIDSGLKAARPQKPLKLFLKKNKIAYKNKTIQISKFRNIYTIAVGKAADSMTKAVDSYTSIKKGIIIIPSGSQSVLKKKKFQVIYSGHPAPNKKSVFAAKQVLDFLKNTQKNDFIIFLVSGGASALLCLPDGISLSEKIKTNEILLKSGATIQEINCIRKHISEIKGGRLVQHLRSKAISLLLSDVIGNDLSSIASGITYYDSTTFGDAIKIIKKYRLEKSMPKRVIQRLKDGAKGKIQETPKHAKIKNIIVLQNSDCLNTMQSKAKSFGLSTKTIPHVSGNVVTVAKKLIKNLPRKSNSCLIFGGEPTVNVLGNGKGGRNQELVLRILQKLSKSKNQFVICSVGTDGIDGNTVDAGAITNNFVPTNQKEINRFLSANNSNAFFKKYGGLIRTSYTHTNLMDIGIILN